MRNGGGARASASEPAATPVTGRGGSAAASRGWLQAAAAGAGIWVAVAGLVDLDRIEVLLLLAPLVLVPLGMGLVAPSMPGALAGVWRAMPAVGTVAAALLAGGLVFRPGWAALGLTLPWVVCTAVFALGGGARALRRLRGAGTRGGAARLGGPARAPRALPSEAAAGGAAATEESVAGSAAAMGPHAASPRTSQGGLTAGLVVDAGLVFLAVGGGWTALSAAGVRPLGFAEPIVLLTGVHFHYSGFVMAALAGLLAARRDDAASKAVGVGVVAGVPLVAVGITAGGVAGLLGVELAAAAVLGIVGIALGTLQAHSAFAGPVVGGPGGGLPRVLLAMSGLCLIVGMVLAVAYPLGRFVGAQWLDIPTMAATHGVLNALGFGLLGLAAWTLAGHRASPADPA